MKPEFYPERVGKVKQLGVVSNSNWFYYSISWFGFGFGTNALDLVAIGSLSLFTFYRFCGIILRGVGWEPNPPLSRRDILEDRSD